PGAMSTIRRLITVELVLAVFPATKAMAAHDRVQIMAPTVSRFSDMATVAVGVLVVSGIFRSWIEVGAWRALVGTTYGLVLLTKVAAFLPMVGLGAVNRFWAKPRLARAVEAPGRGPGAMSTIRRLITVELVLAVVVIGVTASLVNIAPGRVAAGLDGPFTTEIGIGHDNLNLVVDPNRVGENEVHLRVTDETGAPAHVEDAWVLFRMPSEQIGPLVAEAVFLDHGHHVVQGHQLSVAGEWELEIVLRTGDFQEERTTVRIIVNG
ncbi:MAG: copper resistance D family protein, partial [Actinomycetota bacterium]